MAIIKTDYSGPDKPKRAEDRNDLRLRIQSHAHKREFEFLVRRNSVEVKCLNPRNGKAKKAKEQEGRNYDDWRHTLSEQEKIRVFALILDEYRKHSIGDEHGYRGAVLGVAENGDLFLGANTATEQITSPYLKECAEQNMVSAASDMVAYKQVKAKGWNNFDRPKAPKFTELYMMGGVSEAQVPVSCPCGKCTDMLAKNITEGAKVYALPILNQATFDYLNTTGKKTEAVNITLNRDKTLANVRDHVTRETLDESPLIPYLVWQTTVQHLNADREITLETSEQHIAAMQRKANASLCAEAKKLTSLRELKIADQHRQALKNSKSESTLPLFQSFMQDLFTSSQNLVAKAAKLLGLELSQKNPVWMAAANQFVGRRSIAELDAASAGGPANLAGINEFMLSEIRHTLADRMVKDEKAVAGRSWIRKNIPHIRCVVIQLDDGTFHHAVECAGKYDASLPNAEAAAVVQALPSLGQCGIKDVWVMEMNGEAVKKGVLMTSPKEGAERIIKRASVGLKFHFIPLNSGGLNPQTLENITKHRSGAEVMPALFKGSRELPANSSAPHRPWTEFLSQQTANPGLACSQIA